MSMLAQIRSLSLNPFAKSQSVLKKETPSLRREQVAYTPYKLFSDSLQAQLKNWLKMGSYGSFWANRALSYPSTALEVFGRDAGHFKNVVSGFVDIPKKAPALVAKTVEMVAKPSLSAAGSWLATSCDMYNSCADAASAVNRYVPIGSLRTITNINAAATLIYASSQVKETCGKLSRAETAQQKVNLLLKLASSISYVAFGIITLAGLATGVAPAVSLIITLLTSGTLFAMAQFFYEKVYDPERKNENVDPALLKARVQLA